MNRQAFSRVARTLLSPWLLWIVLGSAVSAQPVMVSSVREVIDRWSPEQHVYVKGELGVSVNQLTELEAWLDEYGPHWTVVLLQQSGDEEYRAADGRRFQGMDAVEHALGHGLSNQTDFGRLENPTTGETDGAVFVLFLAERKFSYFASDAQDRRGIGESHWIGELDRPAFRAMRGGGRIVDAVKDTVTLVNQRLNSAIAAEKAQQERLKLERARAQEDVKSDIANDRQAIESVIQAATAIQSQFPQADGEMTRPPIEEWRTSLQRLEEDLSDANVRESAQAVAEISAQINRYLNSYSIFQSFDDRVAELQGEFNKLQGSPYQAVIAGQEKQFRELLAQSTAARQKADAAFVEPLAELPSVLQSAQAAVDAEQRRVAQLEARRQLIRRSVLITLAIVLLALLGLLVWLNRRRAPVKQEALEALRKRRDSVRGEMDRVLEVFGRSREILGSRENAAKRGYEGMTAGVTQTAFKTIDELLIMSNEVDRVMDEAEGLVRPADIPDKLRNLFSAANFERAMNRISGEPLRFDENQGIPAILRHLAHAQAVAAKGDAADATARDTSAETSAASTATPEDTGRDEDSISLTFEQVFTAFHDRIKLAGEALNRLETSLLDVNDRLAEVQQSIDAASELEKQLAEAAEQDGLFEIHQFFQSLIPSAQADQDLADDLAAADPVRAVDELLPTAERKIAEGVVVATLLQKAREELFPKCNEEAPKLKELGYDTTWISQTIGQLGETADALFGEAVEHSVEGQIRELEAAIQSFQGRLQQAVELATDVHETAEPELDAAKQEVARGRERIVQKLGVDPAASMNEDGANPDHALAQAEEQLTATKASLQHGDVEAAHGAMQAFVQHLGEARSIVTRSLGVLDEFESRRAEALAAHQTVAQQVPEVERLVGDLMQRYDSSVQRLQASDPAFPDHDATTESHLRDTRQELDRIQTWLSSVESIYRQGRLLEVDRDLLASREHTELAQALIDDLREHARRLESQSEANRASLQQLLGDEDRLAREAEDDRTRTGTLERLRTLRQSVDQVRQAVIETTSFRDPIGNAAVLQRLASEATELDAMILADREAFAEAERAVEGAVNQLETAHGYVRQARRDGIPDSPLTTRCIQQIEAQVSQVERLRLQLRIPHEAWERVDAEAARLNATIGKLAGELQGELDRAQGSVAALQGASQDVFNAASWTGDLGVRILGSPGSHELDQARDALRRGDYDAMVQLSRAAAVAAQHAIHRAQREVVRRQRERARAEEAARRAEMARRRASRPSISFGSGSSSSGGFGGFGGGIGGGSSIGSSGSSNSGFSRSGW